MPHPFVHDVPQQRVVFAPGAVARVAEEAARLKFARALVIATPDSGARLRARTTDQPCRRACGRHAVAHCVEALWVADRTPVTVAVATEALRRFADNLPRAVNNGANRDARGQCLVAAWLAGLALAAGSALHHKLAHVLGGYGLPHAETHAIILPHATRFNLAAAPQAHERLAEVFHADDPAAAIAAMVSGFPIPQRLRDVGLTQERIADAAAEIAALKITQPRPVAA